MADVITPGQTKDTLSAFYTLSDGSTRAADDATWTDNGTGVANLSTTTGPTVDVLGTDLANGSLTPVVVTVSGGGFTAEFEVDIQATPPAVTGLSVTSSGPVAL